MMNATILALLGYIGWSVILLLVLMGYRTLLVMKKEKQPNGFKADGSDSPEFGQRLTRALGNAFESFAFIGGTMLVALATGAAAITNPLAMYVLYARVAQSLVHMVSTSVLAVQVRFVLFLIQVGIVVYWLVMLFDKFSA